MRFDGTDRRTHLEVVGRGRGAEPTPAQDVRISPDGRHALALVNDQLYLVAVPPIGGDPLTVNVNSAPVPVRRLTEVGAAHLAWADGGSTLTWGLGSSFFRLPLAAVTFESGRESEGEERKLPVEEIVAVIERPRHSPRGVIALRGARVITMRGEEVIPDAEIVITDNRITAVGRRGSVTVPEGARLFDVEGMTIMPGIVDAHAHWFEIRHGVLDIEQNWYFLANLAYGVTTGRDPSNTTDVFAYQDLVDAGEMLGPRVFSTGPAVFQNTHLQSANDAENVVARYKKYYRTNTLKWYVAGNRKQRQWMVEACKEHRIMPTTEGASNLKLDLTHVIDGFSGNEHQFGTFPIYRDVAELVARAGLFYTPTLQQQYGGPAGDDYFFLTTEVHDDPKLQRFIPHNLLDSWTKRRPWVCRGRARLPESCRRGRQDRPCWRTSRHWGTRTAAGDAVSLGHVGAAQWRNDEFRSSAGSDPARCGSDWLCPGSGEHRGGQARRPDRARQEPSGAHSQHQHHRVRDEERRVVRRGHAQPDLAAAENSASNVVVG